MTLSLFRSPVSGLTILPGRASAPEVEAAITEVAAASPFRHQVTPGGGVMSVAMTSCGDVGWVTDRRGYRYDPIDPETSKRWPPMPAAWRALAEECAAVAGFSGFAPDACLVNRYEAGARMGLHQDKDEADFAHPIVSVSLGASAVFLWGGATRSERPEKVELHHGDVVVWGGAARLRFHGVAPVKAGVRHNLTFRRAR